MFGTVFFDLNNLGNNKLRPDPQGAAAAAARRADARDDGAGPALPARPAGRAVG